MPTHADRADGKGFVFADRLPAREDTDPSR
jgi:hypothetical protein